MQEFRVPRLALGGDDRMVVLEWLIAPGERFTEGQVILEVETDKATMEVEAPFDGVLAKVLCDAGTEVEAGRLIAWVADPEEAYDPDDLPDREPSSGEPSGDGAGVKTAESGPAVAVERLPAIDVPRTGASVATVSHGELRGLPPVASRDREASPSGSGPEPDPETAGPFRTVAMSRHRSAVARSTMSSNAVPQFAVLREIPTGSAMQSLDALRQQSQAATLSDVVILAVARALALEPGLNAWFDGQNTYVFEHVNIALAVDGPDGVIAPVIRAVDTLTAPELVDERSRLVSGARDGQLSGRDLLDGTFTVSNIGPLGAHAMVPLLTPPQVAILAVGRGRGEGPAAAITMTVVGDHRAIDGADAARFLAALDRELQGPGEPPAPDGAPTRSGGSG